MVTTKEGGAASLEPAPISLAASVGPTMFAAWAAQWEVDDARIRSIHASLDRANEANKVKILTEV